MSRSILSQLKSLPSNRQRTDVISPVLCDNVLQRLGPSLAEYVGCTIIDINPGAGLFSSKIHELLKPRSHVLLEPKQKHYQSLLIPLLEAPGSRYHIRDWPDEHRWETKHYIREGLMPSADGSGGPSPTTENPNNLTLILGNIANWKLSFSSGRRKSNYAAMKAYDFARSARQSIRSSDAGPPRMLVWMTDSDKHAILPRAVDNRGRLPCLLEEYCHVEEIVGSSVRLATARREDALDAKSRMRVMARMQQNGLFTLEGWEGPSIDQAADLSSTSRDWHRELRDLEEGFKAQNISQFMGTPPGPLVTKQDGRLKTDSRKYTPEYERMKKLQIILRGQNKEIKKVQELVRRQAEIDQLDLEAATSENMDEDKQRMKFEDLDARIQELKTIEGKLSKKELYRFMFLDDDRRAFEMDPPLLMWDRRNAEPLLAQESDFYSPKELALLDFQTKDLDKKQPTTPDQDLYYDMIASALLSHRGPTSVKFLDVIGPGAYQALVTETPSLRDPRKGGRRDVESVRARTMTSEMIRELAIAWESWAFKPPLAEVLNRTLDVNTGELMRDGGPASH